MPNIRIQYFFLAVIILLAPLIYAQQKTFNILIEWPEGLKTEGLSVFVNNGLQSVEHKPNLNDNKIAISDSFVSQYVTISISIEKNNFELPSHSQFYISEKPASITFKATAEDAKHYTFENAYDVAEIALSYHNRIDSLESARDNYLETHDLDSVYHAMSRRMILGKLDFIKQNSNAYYAFRIFKNEIAPFQFSRRDILQDTFSEFYNATFAEEVLMSVEGREVSKMLESRRIASTDGMEAPAFSTTDILGNKIRLQDFKGRYVLLSFWATWCASCVEEIPAIRSIRSRYPEDQLSIISLSYDRNLEALSKGFKKHRMNWTHVFSDRAFAASYGVGTALPQMFLIDKEGMIIYNKSSGKETDYVSLQTLNEVLERELGPKR